MIEDRQMSNFGNKMKDVMSDKNNQIYFGVFVAILLIGIGAYYFFSGSSTEEETADETNVENVEKANTNDNESESESKEDEEDEGTETASEDSEDSSEVTEDTSEASGNSDQEEAEYAEESSEELSASSEDNNEQEAEATEEVATADATIGEEDQAASQAEEESNDAGDYNVNASGSSSAPMSSDGEYVIVSGDWLSKIAQRVYGDMHKWTEIHEMNPQIENPHLIYPGDKINLRP